MDQMKKAWRSALALAAVTAATVLGTAANAGAADEEFSFTAEKYTAVQFGMSRAQIHEMLDVGKTKPGDGKGWCEDDVSILCMTASGDYVPYGNFWFNSADKLIGKRHELLFTPKTPSMTLAKYNRVTVGMTEAQVWSTVSKDSCVLQSDSYPNWPATTGHKYYYYCTASTGLFPPNAHFYFVDGKVTEKYQRALT
ncbi:BLIP family protein [Streptomyces sp. HD]|uniref:BLIP family protein n=1 Tax=Streptomyces sp. HD TaxID=3020892 RepID=UPI0023306A42|nr:BLIP family protein [Streptomyces sp. HD]MDC0769521.1 BLIP family protein [Streptomyces sp. HD]